MARPLVPDALWAELEPLLPPRRPRPKGGRPPLSDRAVLTGILFVLKSGIPWEMLPKEMGCGCGMTCWRRLRDWQTAGVWARLHRVLLDRLGRANADRLVALCRGQRRGRGQKGGEQTGPNPTDRGQAGHQAPSPGRRQRHPARRSPEPGQPARQPPSGADARRGARPSASAAAGRAVDPRKLHADKAYDHARCRQACRVRGIMPRIARRGVDQLRPARPPPLGRRAHLGLVRTLPPPPSATSAEPTSARPSITSPLPSSVPLRRTMVLLGALIQAVGSP